MPDVEALRRQALAAVHDASAYLNERVHSVTDSKELQDIRDQLDWLDEASALIESTSLRATADRTSLERISSDLNSSQARIKELHETSPYRLVEESLRDLDQNLRTFVGTHGSGGGNPIGWPR